MMLSAHALAAIGLTIGALVLLSRDRIPLEYSCIAILTAMVLGFEVFPMTDPAPLRGARFLQGFGNEALITICLLLVLAKGIEVSGALRPVGEFLTRIWFMNRSLALLATMIIAACISAFVNNTPIVVMLLPILVGVAHRTGVSPSKMLMPVGFATIIGGMSTTIGTSTNLLVVSISEELGMQRLQMFDFTLPAVLAAVAGILYLWILAPRLLPERPSLLAGSEPRVFESIVRVGNNSPLVGKSLALAKRRFGNQVKITRVQRGESLNLVRLPTLTLQSGDELHLRGTPEALQIAQESSGNEARPSQVRRAPDERLVEIVVTRGSPLHAKRLSQLQRDMLRGLTPIGWYRPGQRVMTLEKTSDPILRVGDVLLMQGHRHDVQQLLDTPNILILARAIHLPRTSKARLAMAVMAGVVAAAALGFMPIIASALVGVGFMLIGRCLTWDEAWRAIDTKIVLVIVASLALGTALVETGAAAFLARGVVLIVQHVPPAIVLSGLLLFAALLTEIVTNNAIAVIMTPIAMSVANELGVSPLPFVLAVLFGANMSYLTPIGYQTNLLVMSAGGYRFSDFFRAGLPLQVILWVALSVLLPWLYL